MKKSYCIIVAIATATSFFSCSKSDTGDTLPTNYRIDDIHDIELQPSGTQTSILNLSAVYTGKIQERISLSLEDVPAGVGTDISITGGYPAFNTQIAFTDSSATPGTYPIKLVCEGSQTGKKSYTFNLVAKPEIDYNSVLAGTYTDCSNACTSSGGYTITIRPGDKPNKIYIDNIDNTGRTVFANIINNGQQISIPEQLVNYFIYRGGGVVVNSSELQLNLSAVYSSETINCVVYISK
ncbi:hypothetical protein [Taibaiella soli]|uniref:DUF5018 domain-containing protein n=1 Tax=Taibaiella soli TaxID=1649169 RepID=A0A2W2AB22_9BACT|nr:hypothetical protein [Taibaiella soli]PZF72491.1 hypothetical protein DN068_11540 [Taibaiella soli]